MTCAALLALVTVGVIRWRRRGDTASTGSHKPGRAGSTPAPAPILLAALLALGCATGNADWRRESYDTTVEWVGAGDGRCSDPAPFTSIRACLLHDAAYEIARRHPESAELSSEQARLVADLHLAAQMAADGYPEWWVWTYFWSVRKTGWWTWHFGD